jgi:hypothetical protein
MSHFVALITPIYATKENNRLSYFKYTKESALAQNVDFLWVIVNDGSSDPELNDYLHSIKDSRVYVLTRKRKSTDLHTASNALNYGLEYAITQQQCDSFAYLHSDDLLNDNSIKKRMDGLGRCDIIYGRIAISIDGIIYDSYKKFEKPEDIINMSYYFPHHTTMWSRSFLLEMLKERSGILFDPNFYCGEDLDVTYCARRLLEEKKSKLIFINDILYIRVINSKNITSGTCEIEKIRQINEIEYKNGIVNEQNGLNNFSNFLKYDS